MQTERLKKVLETVEEPQVKGSELAWLFRCRGCQTCGFISNPEHPHWISVQVIPNTQVGEPLEEWEGATRQPL